MSGRKQTSASASSSSSRRPATVKCECGEDAVIRTVRNGPNMGSKFYGCPSWPDTKCNMFKLVDENEEHQFEMLEKDTIIAEMEMVQKFKDEKLKKLQRKKEALEAVIRDLRKENSDLNLKLMKSSTDEKSMIFALCLSWLFFGVLYLVK